MKLPCVRFVFVLSVIGLQTHHMNGLKPWHHMLDLVERVMQNMVTTDEHLEQLINHWHDYFGTLDNFPLPLLVGKPFRHLMMAVGKYHVPPDARYKDLDPVYDTALHKAIREDDGMSFHFLMSRGANMELENAHGKTPIMLTYKLRNIFYFSSLARNGADLERVYKRIKHHRDLCIEHNPFFEKPPRDCQNVLEFYTVVLREREKRKKVREQTRHE